MLKTRIIPCLDVADGRVVKGVNFVDLRDAGDPVDAARAERVLLSGRRQAVDGTGRAPEAGAARGGRVVSLF